MVKLYKIPTYPLGRKSFIAWLESKSPGQRFARHKCALCPIARYVREEINQVDHIIVNNEMVTMNNGTYYLPLWAKVFILKVDKSKRPSVTARTCLKIMETVE